jgi:uncharacterized repeat protein (TIGR03803 family)
MRSKKNFAGVMVVLAVVAANLMIGTRCAASDPEYVIHSFHPQGNSPSVNGAEPFGGLIFDASGNLYGTTGYGGTDGSGTVFELSPRVGGGWTETVLHSFTGSSSGGADGAFPGPSLVFDAVGNLYGTTYAGGTPYQYGFGTVFELSPAEDGTWTETVLYSFGSATADGLVPASGVIIDKAGNLYGTTTWGGAYGHLEEYPGGTAFELSPGAGGLWTEIILHSFGSGNDGYFPQAGLTLDAAGNLYGTTLVGGGGGSCGEGCGTVFELSPAGGGAWTETILHQFVDSGEAPYTPHAGLIFDALGNLYGTAENGGYGYGAVYELSPAGGASWKLKILHGFGHGTDGMEPEGTLLLDAAGNLYGTTLCGGAYGGCESFTGTVFELSPSVGGAWSEKVLHSFGHGGDGSFPYADLIFDAAGNLYGTTSAGGAYGGYGGTVFRIKP